MDRLRHAWRWALYTVRGLIALTGLWRFLLVLIAASIPGALGTANPILRAQIAGVILQVAGVCTVVVGLLRDEELFKIPNFIERFRLWRQRGPKLHPAHHEIHGSVVLGLTTAGEGTFRRGDPSEMSLVDRVRVLEADVSTLREQAEALRRLVKEEEENRRKADERETEERAAGDTSLSERLERFAVGSIALDYVGVSWLLVGIVFAGLPSIVAPLFALFPPV